MVTEAGRRPPPRLLLSTDYRAPSPVWLSTTTVLSDLSTLGLRQHLIDALLAWQHHFDEHFTPGGGWSSAETATAFATQGHQLHDRLSRALPHTTVTLDLWPMNPLEPPEGRHGPRRRRPNTARHGPRPHHR